MENKNATTGTTHHKVKKYKKGKNRKLPLGGQLLRTQSPITDTVNPAIAAFLNTGDIAIMTAFRTKNATKSNTSGAISKNE